MTLACPARTTRRRSPTRLDVLAFLVRYAAPSNPPVPCSCGAFWVPWLPCCWRCVGRKGCLPA